MVLQQTTVAGEVTTVVYQHVSITAPAGPAEAWTTPTQTRITTTIPVAAEYEHIHFGVWAGLGAAAADGSQEIADLGIGFVQDISGEGPTADMPNSGSATYNGNWVATVREADFEGDGDISLENGPRP